MSVCRMASRGGNGRIETQYGGHEWEYVDLKPCPFCGGEAELRKERHYGGKVTGYDYTPRCKNASCAGRLTKKYFGLSKAVDAWNKRMEAMK